MKMLSKLQRFNLVRSVHKKICEDTSHDFLCFLFFLSSSTVIRMENEWSHTTQFSGPAHLFCIFIWSLIKNERFGNLVELVSRLAGNGIFDHLRSLETVCLKILLCCSQQCCGSMKFWYRSISWSGSSYPYLWLMVPDPDPAIFISDLQWRYIYIIFQR